MSRHYISAYTSNLELARGREVDCDLTSDEVTALVTDEERSELLDAARIEWSCLQADLLPEEQSEADITVGLWVD